MAKSGMKSFFHRQDAKFAKPDRWEIAILRRGVGFRSTHPGFPWRLGVLAVQILPASADLLK
jgi:hypothetical protein